jgi:hypothetical protein
MTEETIEAKARRTFTLVKRLRERHEHEAADRIEELEKMFHVVTGLYVRLRRESGERRDQFGSRIMSDG